MELSNLNILIVEDEKNLGMTLFEFLSSKGANCFLAEDAKSAKTYFSKNSINLDVILMDIELPDGNGISLAKEFLKLNRNFTLLFLSAQNDPETRVSGLSIGADDYVTKPFDLRELMFRLKKILQNKTKSVHENDEIKIGKLKIWFKRFEIEDASGEVLSLSQKEVAILSLLYQNKNNVVSRDEIIDKVWGIDQFPSSRTVDNYIVKLRKWCDSDEEGHVRIHSIRGVGYKLEMT